MGTERGVVGGTLEGTHVSLSSQQFVCMLERLLDRSNIHCTAIPHALMALLIASAVPL
jgi:hypothetical protein